MTIEFVCKRASFRLQELAPPPFALVAPLMLTTPMQTISPLLHKRTNPAAQAASIGGTRQLIAEDCFDVLVALLVDCGAVRRDVMAATLERLSDRLIAKARGELETEFSVYPAEIFDRARKISETSARLRRC